MSRGDDGTDDYRGTDRDCDRVSFRELTGAVDVVVDRGAAGEY
jgi:hypothetical protein